MILHVTHKTSLRGELVLRETEGSEDVQLHFKKEKVETIGDMCSTRLVPTKISSAMLSDDDVMDTMHLGEGTSQEGMYYQEVSKALEI